MHLSDLHFGAVAEETVQPLLRLIEERRPELVVISGDLTQRARRRQFQLAGDFIRSLPAAAVIAVPGNHDIPLWDVIRRLVAPRRRFDRFVCADPFPTYLHHQAAVVGVNTARSLTIKNGRISREQLAQVEKRLAVSATGALRIVVAHHPFVIPEGEPLSDRVGRTEIALPILLEAGVDLLLTGHRHHSWMSSPRTGLLSVHAGTALSRRVRHEENACNEIVIDDDALIVRRYLWQRGSASFATPHRERARRFPRCDGRIVTEGSS